MFAKVVEGRGGLGNLKSRNLGRALITADDDDPLWHMAHRILAPAFGTGALKNYYGRIVEVADQMLAHLDRMGPDDTFLATELMTRMTFEAISYAAFNKRYGSIDSAAPAAVRGGDERGSGRCHAGAEAHPAGNLLS